MFVTALAHDMRTAAVAPRTSYVWEHLPSHARLRPFTGIYVVRTCPPDWKDSDTRNSTDNNKLEIHSKCSLKFTPPVMDLQHACVTKMN
jgi:hypothetical protein